MTVTRDADHRYWTEGGLELPSVTSILRPVIDDDAGRFYTEASRQRGTDIHQAIADHFDGLAPVLTPEAAPYWPPLLKFLRESGFQIESAEQVVADEAVGYAGTYDFLGWLAQYGRSSTEVDLVDVKTGAVPRTVWPQTAAYARPLRSRYGVIRRWCLQLTPDRCRLVPLNVQPSGRVDRLADRRDETLFLAAHTISNFRRQPATVGAETT